MSSRGRSPSPRRPGFSSPPQAVAAASTGRAALATQAPPARAGTPRGPSAQSLSACAIAELMLIELQCPGVLANGSAHILVESTLVLRLDLDHNPHLGARRSSELLHDRLGDVARIPHEADWIHDLPTIESAWQPFRNRLRRRGSRLRCAGGRRRPCARTPLFGIELAPHVGGRGRRHYPPQDPPTGRRRDPRPRSNPSPQAAALPTSGARHELSAPQSPLSRPPSSSRCSTYRLPARGLPRRRLPGRPRRRPPARPPTKGQHLDLQVERDPAPAHVAASRSQVAGTVACQIVLIDQASLVRQRTTRTSPWNATSRFERKPPAARASGSARAG